MPKNFKTKQDTFQAIDEFLENFFTSGRFSQLLESLEPKEQIRTVMQLMPYHFPKAKEKTATSEGVSEELKLFYSRLDVTESRRIRKEHPSL